MKQMQTKEDGASPHQPLTAATRASPIPLSKEKKKKKSDAGTSLYTWMKRIMTGIGDQRIATSRFNKSVSRLYTPGLLCRLDHPQRDSVLDASSSIEIFQLGIDLSFDS